MRASFSRFLKVRTVRYHLRCWGRVHDPLLVLLHGWCDASISFQFVVDALQQNWQVVAPDWRGFGLSARGCDGAYADAFWFSDYLADLDAILNDYSANHPVILAGHSLGGNVALLYAGIRPERIRGVISLDGYGLADSRPEQAVQRLRDWLSHLRRPLRFHVYPNQQSFAHSLLRYAPGLTEERAAFLAESIGEKTDCGGISRAAEPAHLQASPLLYHRAETDAVWREITAPALWLVQADPQWRRQRLGLGDEEYLRAQQNISRLEVEQIANTGHNMHLEQPEAVAAAIEHFCLRHNLR